MSKRIFPMRPPSNKDTGQAKQKILDHNDLSNGDYPLDDGRLIYRKQDNIGLLVRQYRFLGPKLQGLTIEKCEAKFPLGQIIVPPTH